MATVRSGLLRVPMIGVSGHKVSAK
jgi:hypothetical protein